MNYKKNSQHYSGFILFGYANTTDPEPINMLFEKYTSYTIRVRDFYTGIQNNIFCFVFVNLVITKIPDPSYFYVKNKIGRIIYEGDSINLEEELTITKKSTGSKIPKGRYVLGFAPYLNEAEYDDFYECSLEKEIYGEEIPFGWKLDEFYGRTTEFKFTVDIDCFENCESCSSKGSSIDDQQCDTCKYGFYLVENTKNCLENAPDGYYLDRDKKIYRRCHDKCKTCTNINIGNIQNCLSCYNNYLLYNSTNCLNCKSQGKYVNYEQTECIDSVPIGFYVNNTGYNTIDKCHPNCMICSKGSINNENMNCLSCNNSNKYYFVENTNNCQKDPFQVII